MRHAVLAAAALGLGVVPAAAQSKPATSRGSCNATQKQLEEAERQGHLREAQGLALSCSAAACGSWTSQRCRARAQALAADIPSVVPIALDEAGAPIADVELRIDGAPAASPINGRALELDPGVHELSFSAPGREAHAEKVVVVQGVRNRQLSIVLRATSTGEAPVAPPAAAVNSSAVSSSAVNSSAVNSSEPAPPAPVAPHSEAAPSGAKTSAWPYVVGGVGLASLGVSVAFLTWGHHDSELLDQCSPNCSQDSADHVKQMYIAADISLGVGVVALGVATWLYLSEPPGAAPADHAQLQFDVQPLRGGAFATVEQTF
jgi:hypothetical protein